MVRAAESNSGSKPTKQRRPLGVVVTINLKTPRTEPQSEQTQSHIETMAASRYYEKKSAHSGPVSGREQSGPVSYKQLRRHVPCVKHLWNGYARRTGA